MDAFVQVIEHEAPFSVAVRRSLLGGAPGGGIVTEGHVPVVQIEVDAAVVDQALDVHQFIGESVGVVIGKIALRDHVQHILPCSEGFFR